MHDAPWARGNLASNFVRVLDHLSAFLAAFLHRDLAIRSSAISPKQPSCCWHSARTAAQLAAPQADAPRRRGRAGNTAAGASPPSAAFRAPLTACQAQGPAAKHQHGKNLKLPTLPRATIGCSRMVATTLRPLLHNEGPAVVICAR